MGAVNFSLSYTGGMAASNQIDLYDAAQALIGFQRSLAITTHLVLNGNVITQAPYLRGARILSIPPESGSWKIVASVAIALYSVGTASKETPIGHLVSSAYDYVISETLGFHVDYNKTLGQQYDEIKSKNKDIHKLNQSQLDSVIEKCQVAIRDMHRPIANSETAEEAHISVAKGGKFVRFKHDLTINTYEYISFTERRKEAESFVGVVSSYNKNTFKGRVFVFALARPIPFELSEMARNKLVINTVVKSLAASALNEQSVQFKFLAYRNESKSGQLKSLYVIKLSDPIKFGLFA